MSTKAVRGFLCHLLGVLALLFMAESAQASQAWLGVNPDTLLARYTAESEPLACAAVLLQACQESVGAVLADWLAGGTGKLGEDVFGDSAMVAFVLDNEAPSGCTKGEILRALTVWEESEVYLEEDRLVAEEIDTYFSSYLRVRPDDSGKIDGLMSVLPPVLWNNIANFTDIGGSK